MTWREFLFGAEHLPFWFFALRAIVLYLALVAATRWMGHRQVGILSGHNYLVAAGIVSVAALRTVHADSSLLSGLTIVLVYAGVNVLLSRLDLRWPRLGGCLKLSEAWSAVLEPTGKLSIIKKSAASPVTRKDFGLGPIPAGALEFDGILTVVRQGERMGG